MNRLLKVSFLQICLTSALGPARIFLAVSLHQLLVSSRLMQLSRIGAGSDIERQHNEDSTRPTSSIMFGYTDPCRRTLFSSLYTCSVVNAKELS